PIVTLILTGGLALLAAIPPIVFLVRYAFIAQVVVLENQAGSAGLSRSKQIGLGYGWRIFGIMLLLFIMGMLVLIGLGGALALVMPPTQAVRTALGEVPNTNYFNHIVVTLVIYVL